MFAFRLCLALGFAHPDILMAQISSKQLAEWRAFYAIDPWGEWRQDRRTALLGSMQAASYGKKVNLDDLMLFDPEVRRRKEAQQRANLVTLRKWLEGKATKKD